jgi:hypothetical protein
MAALIDTVGEHNPPVPEVKEQSTEGLRQWCMYYTRGNQSCIYGGTGIRR